MVQSTSGFYQTVESQALKRTRPGNLGGTELDSADLVRALNQSKFFGGGIGSRTAQIMVVTTIARREKRDDRGHDRMLSETLQAIKIFFTE